MAAPQTTESKTDAADAGNKDQVPAKEEMRTVLLPKYGDSKILRIIKKQVPELSEGNVIIRVKACGLTFMDLMARQGAIDNAPKPPCGLGLECCGDIEQVGEGVKDFKVGDKVIALCDHGGAWSEVVSVSSKYVYRMPSTMTYQDGAALSLNYLLAYIMLFEMGNIRKGHSVLVHSAGGGVGMAVSQLVKQVPDVVLFGTASYHKHEVIKNNLNHLFDHVVDYVQEIKKICPEGVDLVLDCLSGDDVNKGYSLLKPLGRYILYGSSNVVAGETKSFFNVAKAWWQVDKISPVKLYEDNKFICGLNLRQLLFEQGKHDYVRDIMNRLFKLYTDGKIRPHIDTAFALEDVGDAMQKLHDRKNIGKIIIDPSMAPRPKTQASIDKEAVAAANQSPPPST